jgi:uncharacterized membrane protein YozB (DUF420 family)
VACALAGVREVRAGRVREHQRRMIAAGSLVALFLVSYVFKVLALGREDRSGWSAGELAVLYLHETCVAVMLLAGGYAGVRAWRFRASLGANAPNPLPAAVAVERLQHRLGGRTAVVAAVFALLTAGAVLAGMYARAG